MEDIPVTIVGIEQNSLINGSTNRSSLTGGGGGVNIVTFSRCMLGSSPVHVTHGQPMPTSMDLIATANCMQWFPRYPSYCLLDVSILLTFGIGLTRFVA